jgi:hypothetical protein
MDTPRVPPAPELDARRGGSCMIALIMFVVLWLVVVIGGWLAMAYLIPHVHGVLPT